MPRLFNGGKNSLFNKWCLENWISTFKRTKLDPHPAPFYSKWINDQNIKPKTIKLLEENIGQNLHDTGFSNDFLNMTPQAQVTKEKTDKSDFMKM